MGFFRRIGQLFTGGDDSDNVPNSVRLRELTTNARRAQYAENYQEALDHLQEAYEIAESEKDKRTQIDINLSRGDILIAQEDYETAAFVLGELRDESEASHLKAPLAYALCSLGVLAQRQGDLVKAQQQFEKAREIAEAINTDGASGRATAHLGDIYLLQDNASYAVYLLEDAVKKLDRSGDRELLGYFYGRLGIAQIQTGQNDKGEVHLRRGLELAINIKHLSQMRLLNALVAENEMNKGKYRRAQAYFKDALNLYPEPPPQTSEYARLLCLTSRVTLDLGDSYSALDYAEQALPIAEKEEDTSLEAMARALKGLAKGALAETDALTHLEEAAALYDELAPDAFMIDILRNLANAQFGAGQDEQGLATLKRAIAKADDFPQEAGKVYTDIATYYAQKRQLRDAIAAWQKALPLFEDAHHTSKVAGIHCDIAYMYDQLGDGKMAQREYGTTLEMLSRIGDANQRGIILANVAAAYSMYGDVESAQDFFTESINIAQRDQNAKAEITRRGNYGRLLAMTNRPKEALTQLMQAHKRAEELDFRLAAIILSNIGLAYAALDDAKASVERYQLALEQLETLGTDGDPWRARLYANWGDVALETGELETANSYYQQAHELAQAYAMVDVLIQAVVGRARVEIQTGDLEQAQTDLDKITAVAKRQDYQQHLAMLHQAYSEHYAAKGDIDSATNSWETAERIRNIVLMKPVTPDWL